MNSINTLMKPLLFILITVSKIVYSQYPNSIDPKNFDLGDKVGLPANPLDGIIKSQKLSNSINNNFQNNTFNNNQREAQNLMFENHKKIATLNEQLLNTNHFEESEAIDLAELERLNEISYYTAAYNELMDMVIGLKPYDFNKAIFITENAYLDNALKFKEYNAMIKEKVRLARLIMKREKLDASNQLSKNYAIQQLYNVTITEKRKDGSIKVTKPMKYDFNDIYGTTNHTQVFATKLLKTGKGQCASMPLIAKAIANELNAKCYLTNGPKHLYIQFLDNNGELYNFETTNGMNTTKEHVTQSGYISATAIKNKTYMDTLTKDKELSLFLTNLSTSFIKKFGYERVIENWATNALMLDSTSITALMVLSNFYTHHFKNATIFYNIRTKEQLQQHPAAMALKKQRDFYYKKVDDSGYQQMPNDAYEAWLKSMEKEKLKKIEGLSLGAIDYIFKPFLIGELTHKIESVLNNLSEQRRAIIEGVYHSIVSKSESEPILNLHRFEENCNKYNLTLQERKIIPLIAKGKANKEIATVLFISDKTVKKHLQNIFEKVTVTNKVELLSKLEIALSLPNKG